MGVCGSYVSSKASPPKLNQRQPPGVTSQTPIHSSHKDMVWHSPPMTRQPQLSLLQQLSRQYNIMYRAHVFYTRRRTLC